MPVNTPAHTDNATGKKRIRNALINSLLYLGLCLVFYLAFTLIKPYYINDPSKNGPVDSRAGECEFFDAGYVYDAKHGIYEVAGYFQLFVPLDLAFPIAYTLLFLAILTAFNKKPFYKVARYFVLAGMIFDYLENITFSIYLKSSLEISSLIAFFTTIKTFLFVINSGVFLFALICASIIFLRPKKIQGKEDFRS